MFSLTDKFSEAMPPSPGTWMKRHIHKCFMKNLMLIIALKKTLAQGRNHPFVGLASSTACREVQGPASHLASVG